MAGYRDAPRDSAREGLRLVRNDQSDFHTVINLQHLGLVGHVDAQFNTLGYEREPTERIGYHHLMMAYATR